VAFFWVSFKLGRTFTSVGLPDEAVVHLILDGQHLEPIRARGRDLLSREQLAVPEAAGRHKCRCRSPSHDEVAVPCLSSIQLEKVCVRDEWHRDYRQG